ncbi:MAG: helix-turn-helix transcriptional regulator [Alphaproteobacteria bacterium]|nr:helix-turn-helix transcriptional regulator [Alphaproteobacteria bacterium]
MSENLKKTIGNRVKAFRKAKRPKMSQERLAELCDVGTRTISNIECGVGVSLEVLEKIVAVLGCTYGDLMDTDAHLRTEQSALKNEAATLIATMNGESLSRAVRVLKAL